MLSCPRLKPQRTSERLFCLLFRRTTTERIPASFNIVYYSREIDKDNRMIIACQNNPGPQSLRRRIARGRRSSLSKNFLGVTSSQASTSFGLCRSCLSIGLIGYGCWFNTRARYALICLVSGSDQLTFFSGCPETNHESFTPYVTIVCSESHQESSALQWTKMAPV